VRRHTFSRVSFSCYDKSQNSPAIIIELFLSSSLAWLVLLTVSPHLDFIPASAPGSDHDRKGPLVRIMIERYLKPAISAAVFVLVLRETVRE
jgi:hypothetical protein